jgi:hypothetical protein
MPPLRVCPFHEGVLLTAVSMKPETHVIDAARATADLAKGFLTVRMPKSSERTTEERRVAIAEGK